ncbi:MAG: hypothetical protein AAGA27_08625, partial [Pseudomonadota bacterium]
MLVKGKENTDITNVLCVIANNVYASSNSRCYIESDIIDYLVLNEIDIKCGTNVLMTLFDIAYISEKNHIDRFVTSRFYQENNIVCFEFYFEKIKKNKNYSKLEAIMYKHIKTIKNFCNSGKNKVEKNSKLGGGLKDMIGTYCRINSSNDKVNFYLKFNRKQLMEILSDANKRIDDKYLEFAKIKSKNPSLLDFYYFFNEIKLTKKYRQDIKQHTIAKNYE